MIALLVMTDGRDTIHETIASAREALRGDISERWIHNDSGDPEHTARLRQAFPDFMVVSTPGRSGFGGAIRSAWSTLRRESTARFVFHLEDDFTFRRPVELADMADVLTARPHLVQLALRRQPCNSAELAAGGIVEQHPDDYEETGDGSHRWLEHRRFFTTNPSLYRRQLIEEHDWPTGTESEGRFGLGLFAADPAARCGYWGARASGEAVRHIGTHRTGTGY